MPVLGSALCCGSHPDTDHSGQYTSHRTQEVEHNTLVYTLDITSKILAPSTSAAEQSAAVTAPPGQTCPHGLTLVWLGWVQHAEPHPEPQLHPTGPPELALPLSTNPTEPQPSLHSSLPHSALPGPARYMHAITGQRFVLRICPVDCRLWCMQLHHCIINAIRLSSLDRTPQAMLVSASCVVHPALKHTTCHDASGASLHALTHLTSPAG